MKNPLLDKNFLIKLDNVLVKEKWAKIIALDINENPTEEITGRITDGSINVDGKSAVRRTCSLTMVAQDVNINDFYWGLNTKFKMYVGITNNIDKTYPDIIWFPQGVFLITSFSLSYGTNNLNISIQGKDKMCLLNGELGGALTAPIDFGKVEEKNENGDIKISDIPIKDIIKESVHEYGLEPWHNIIINDLDDYGVELMEYRGTKPLYLFINEETKEVNQITLNGDQIIYYYDEQDQSEASIKIKDIDITLYNKLNEFYPGMSTDYLIGYFNNESSEKYSVAKVEYGQTAGYRLTNITYAGDLIANVGESLTSILDKIVQMLGQFEYFYDVDGRFIFQKKKTYIQTTWSGLTEDDSGIVIPDNFAEEFGYEFKGSDLIISFSNNPNISNIKNDFSIWGSRKTAAGAEVPIHLRYAIDKKPTKYVSFGISNEEAKEYNSIFNPSKLLEPRDAITYSAEDWDWRELIYQMAKDYRKFNHWDRFLLKVRDANIAENGEYLFPEGYTGYEPYYIDIEGFWRQLYNPNYLTDDESLGGDGQIETKINPNDDGVFEEDLFDQVYVYPFRKAFDDNGNKTPVNILPEEDRILNNAYCAFLVDLSDVEKVWNIQTFEDRVEFNNNLTYAIKDYNNDFKEVPKESLNKYSKKSLYVKLENNGYEPFLDYALKEAENGGSLKNILFYRTRKKTYIAEFIDGGIYIKNKDKKIVWPCYFTKQTGETDYFKQTPIEYYYSTYNYYGKETGSKKYWHKNVWEAPEMLNFWFDVLETGEMAKYSVSAIGRRTKSVNETSIKSIYFRETPTILFINKNNISGWELTERKEGYTYINISDSMLSLFKMSGQGVSAQNKLEECIQNDTACVESVSINIVPIYYLQPNTKIYIRDDKNNIDGEYSISNFNIPLNYSGTMSVSAVKIPSRIY